MAEGARLNGRYASRSAMLRDLKQNGPREGARFIAALRLHARRTPPSGRVRARKRRERLRL
ncbi:hypothetical protein, partial [Escherichia coli]|uniref:hypothetical protein n=1 Tax=Escherichia coli TaxID=562 RepID=UPI0019D5CF67